MTMAQATRVLGENAQWSTNLQDDHAHDWDNGSAATVKRGYRYIDIY